LKNQTPQAKIKFLTCGVIIVLNWYAGVSPANIPAGEMPAYQCLNLRQLCESGFDFLVGGDVVGHCAVVESLVGIEVEVTCA